jgi:hypothetical protein
MEPCSVIVILYFEIRLSKNKNHVDVLNENKETARD